MVGLGGRLSCVLSFPPCDASEARGFASGPRVQRMLQRKRMLRWEVYTRCWGRSKITEPAWRTSRGVPLALAWATRAANVQVNLG